MAKMKTEMIKLNLQAFAEYPANSPTQVYEQQFRELLEPIFRQNAYFTDFFNGGIEALDGVSSNQKAFTVKTNDMPVIFNEYDKSANTAFGTGTSNSNRFGERKEVIYTDEDVNYTWEWSWHEGIDRHTVNADFDQAVADRLEAQAIAKVSQFNAMHANFVASSAGQTEALATYGEDDVLALFNTLAKYYTNKKVVGRKVAKVSPELYNAIVDHPKATTGKNSSANIDDNSILRFKGFDIEEMPDDAFTGGNVAYTYVAGVAKAFTGINTSRTIESEDFDGVAFQGAGKAGEYIPEKNKEAVVAVAGPEEAPAG